MVRMEEYVYKGHEFVSRVAQALQKPEDTQSASSVTVAVFRQLRQMLSPGESLHLIAQLPLYVKAVYVDGWRIEEELKHRPSAGEFNAVFSVLKKYVSSGEVQHILAQLPEEMKKLEMLNE